MTPSTPIPPCPRPAGGTFHGDVVDGELEAAPTPRHSHRVPLVVVQLLPRQQRLGALAWGAGVSGAARGHQGHQGDTGDTAAQGQATAMGDTGGHRGDGPHCDTGPHHDTAALGDT